MNHRDDKGWSLGIIGGTGMLGSAIAGAVLDRQVVSPERLWISNRSGQSDAFDRHPGVNVTAANQSLTDACDVILLSVPPASAPSIAIDASDQLVISVMAGVPLETLKRITGASRIIRAMSSPAAADFLAYSPWCAGTEVGPTDRARTSAIFTACGLTDEVATESDIDVFTAITGPVPGFVAFFAAAMIDYATARGIPPETADRAVRQLFLGAGKMMSAEAMTPADHVRQMTDYAGTTAAGLEVLQSSSLPDDITKALDAAVAKTRSIG